MSDSDDEIDDTTYNDITNTQFFLFITVTLIIDASDNESQFQHTFIIIPAFVLAIWFYFFGTIHGNRRQHQPRLPNRDTTNRRSH